MIVEHRNGPASLPKIGAGARAGQGCAVGPSHRSNYDIVSLMGAHSCGLTCNWVSSRGPRLCACARQCVCAGDAVQGGGIRWDGRAAAHVAVVLPRTSTARASARVGFVGLPRLALVCLSPLPTPSPFPAPAVHSRTIPASSRRERWGCGEMFERKKVGEHLGITFLLCDHNTIHPTASTV